MKQLLLIFIALLAFQPSEAQLMKRLKNKVENKVNRKIDRAVDKTIDEALEGEAKKPSEEAKKQDPVPSKKQTSSQEGTFTDPYDTRNRDYGDATVTNPIHGSMNVDELGIVKVERVGNTYKIWGSWWTHQADIYDGFVIEIFDAETIFTDDNPAKTSFNIPEEASLKLSYDPSFPAKTQSNDSKTPAVTDKYLDYSINSGSLTINLLNDETIQFSFEGPDGISGTLSAESPDIVQRDETVKADAEPQDAFTPPTGGAQFGDQVNKTFNFQYAIENQMVDQKTKESYNITYRVNLNESYLGMEADMGNFSEGEVDGESFIIMDGENMLMLINSSGMKMQMAPKAGMVKDPNEQMDNLDYQDIKKTGAKKTILGYTCHEYVMHDTKEDMQVNFWVAPDLDIPNIFTQAKEGEIEMPFEGYVLESEIISPDGHVINTVTKIDKNAPFSIDASEYKKMF